MKKSHNVFVLSFIVIACGGKVEWDDEIHHSGRPADSIPNARDDRDAGMAGGAAGVSNTGNGGTIVEDCVPEVSISAIVDFLVMVPQLEPGNLKQAFAFSLTHSGGCSVDAYLKELTLNVTNIEYAMWTYGRGDVYPDAGWSFSAIQLRIPGKAEVKPINVGFNQLAQEVHLRPNFQTEIRVPAGESITAYLELEVATDEDSWLALGDRNYSVLVEWVDVRDAQNNAPVFVSGVPSGATFFEVTRLQDQPLIGDECWYNSVQQCRTESGEVGCMFCTLGRDRILSTCRTCSQNEHFVMYECVSGSEAECFCSDNESIGLTACVLGERSTCDCSK